MVAPAGKQVQSMFGEIAERYDFLNGFLSFGIDRLWRRRAIKSAAVSANDTVLDLCCGTGDLAIAFATEGCQTIGADFTYQMLAKAPPKADKKKVNVEWVQADAQQLPFADDSFNVVSIAFGIRNVENVELAIQECHRVLKEGGRLVVLDFFNFLTFFSLITFRDLKIAFTTTI